MKMKKKFTLVEILMVTGMICLIAALILVAYNGVYRSWATRNTIATMKAAHLALDRYMLEHGAYPTPSSNNELGKTAQSSGDIKLINGLLQECSPYSYKDSSGNLVIYDDFGPKPPETPAMIYYVAPYNSYNSFALMSKGKNGSWGGDDDIIYLPRGRGTLKPGFYMCSTNETGSSISEPEPLAQ